MSRRRLGRDSSNFISNDKVYFTDNNEGFFEVVEGAEGESTEETIVFASEEEAAAIGVALSGEEAAAGGSIDAGCLRYDFYI